MTCPYAEPNCSGDVPANARRCRCRRVLKRCSACSARNRALANFCRGCGAPLPHSDANWVGYKGGAQRLGFNAAPVGSDFITLKTDLHMRLGDECRALLGYDGHLIAVSLGGVVEIVDPLRPQSVFRFQAQGPITAEPCIRDGVLYLGTRGQLTAYSLGAMTLETPRVRPLWQVRLDGVPTQPLTALGNRLYVTIASRDGREVHVIDQLDRPQPGAARRLYSASKMSWIAADPATSEAVFLSEDHDRRVLLHVVDGELETRDVSLHQLVEQPVAFLGGTVFAIFGEAHRLYRIDAATGSVEEPLDEDTQMFALSHDGNGEWDRDGVRIDSAGVVFSRSGIRDSFAPQERAVKGSPLIVQHGAAVVGMEDGSVRIYDLARAPRYESWRVGSSGAAISALASFDSYIAAGNREGIVEVRELRAKTEVRR